MSEGLTLRQALRAQWRDVGREVRVACLFLLVTGGALFLIGIAGDFLGWWADHSFLTNVLSSVTGACFGIPAAILLFAAISERRVAVTLRRDRLRQGAFAAERLRASAAPFVAVGAGEDLIGPATAIAERVASLRETLKSPRGNSEAVRQELLVLVAGIEKGREQMLRSLPLSIIDSEKQWAELSNSWRSINDVVRNEYLASDLPWLDDATQATLQALLYDTPNPFRYILELRDLQLPEYSVQCARLSRAQGPLDFNELTSLELHQIDEAVILDEGLTLLRRLDELHEGVEKASFALCHPGKEPPKNAASAQRTGTP